MCMAPVRTPDRGIELIRSDGTRVLGKRPVNYPGPLRKIFVELDPYTCNRILLSNFCTREMKGIVIY